MVDAGVFTRIIYGIALALLGVGVVSHVRYAMFLFKQMPTNDNVVNPIAATTIVIVAIVVAIAVVSRVWGLIRGKVRLSSHPASGLTSLIRSAGLAFMTVGVLLAVGLYIALVVTRIGAVALIGAHFQLLLPAGIGLYELSRVMSFERNADEA
jgi:hypothetical protein